MTPMRHPVSKTLVATALAAGLVAGGVTTTRAFADPEESTTTPEARGGQTPGTVYANRTLPDDDLVPGAASAEQFSYWTQGTDERTHLSTAVLLHPKGKAPSGGWPVIAYAYDPAGVAQQCSASESGGAVDAGAVSSLLQDDYAVVLPGYSTIPAAGSPQFADFTVAAHVVSDAVRAATDVESDLSPRWAVVGEGLGAGAAIELGSKGSGWETKKLDFRGAAATDLPIGYSDTVADLSPRSADAPSSVVTDVVYTLASLDDKDVAPLLSTRGKKLVEQAKTTCATALTRAIGTTDLSDLVRKPISSNGKLAAQMRDRLGLISRGFSRPVLISQKLVDKSADVPTSLGYLANAQLASNKVVAKTYLTTDGKTADRQEDAEVSKFVKGLF
ncbi:alpha/beta hydrolase [Gordonia zhaorongruii]|uniref:alpha/beta hydrolase n=1 Tax=Gordonia zhaorongruii TaxID=2597659 RepID=UPI0010521FA4|nr:alpha/beta hydrolase [Gordonia zhaorongruii]